MTSPNFSRRDFCRAAAATSSLAVFSRVGHARGNADADGFPPVRAITHGPKFHWFGYYDKLQFDPTGRYVLSNQVDFEHRSPKPDDVIQVGMVDLQDNDRWIELGESRAWCWQQGCMLQWLPGSSTEVLWNDREGDQFVCHILDVKSGTRRTIPSSIHALSPDGKSAVTLDYSRIADVRPGYGYSGRPDPYADDPAPRESGIFHVDLATGAAKLIVPIADIARYGELPNPKPGIKHYLHHLLYNPSGSRFIALHRWLYPDGSRLSRMFTANADGSDIRFVIPNGHVSHYIWRDDEHILAQSKDWVGNSQWGDFLFEDKDSGIVEEIGRGVLDSAGHPSYLPDRDLAWILNDTYPQRKSREQKPHLFHVPTRRRIDLGHFHSPSQYTDEWRCDTHPRFSPNGKLVTIDSPHGGNGRQIYLIDVSNIS